MMIIKTLLMSYFESFEKIGSKYKGSFSVIDDKAQEKRKFDDYTRGRLRLYKRARSTFNLSFT